MTTRSINAMTLRGMHDGDLADILSLQVAAYPGILHESAEFFLNRLALSASTCWVARDSMDGGMLGYLVAYPWSGGLPPALGVPLAALPAQADHWFLHDCAVHPHAQGRGVGKALYETGRYHAQGAGLRHGSLVALASAASYWLRLGYAAPLAPMPGLKEKLRQYGDGACYLTRALD